MNKPKIVIVGMVYKSVKYLNFMMRQIQEFCLSNTKQNVDYLIIANDANEAVLNKLREWRIKYLWYRDSEPEDYYLNRVYRAWNFGGFSADGDILLFINSDMAFSPGWLDNLMVYFDEKTIPCSRLVESGKLLSRDHAISKDFGRSCDTFKKEEFLDYAKGIQNEGWLKGGLFMPFPISKKDFVKSGGYPEGNIYQGGIGAWKTPCIASGDAYFFYHNPVMKKKKHITVFDSIVYHIQEGEKDE